MPNKLGTKRSCPECAAHFYDLNKNPAICPKCKTEIDIEADDNSSLYSVASSTAADGGDIDAAGSDGGSGLVVDVDSDKNVALQQIDGAGDIDLSDFNDADDVTLTQSIDGMLSDIEDVEELGEDIEALSELEDREIEEDKLNTDDADDDMVIEEMEELETLIDRVDDTEGEEESFLTGKVSANM